MSSVRSQHEEEIFGKIITGTLRRDLINYTPAQFVPALISILSVIVFTRIFDPELYGEYLVVIATVNIVVTIASQWLQQSIIRFLPEQGQEDDQRNFNRTIMFLLLLTAGTIILLSLINYLLWKDTLGKYRRYAFWGTSFTVLLLIFNVLGAEFRARLESRYFALYQVFNSIFGLLFSLLLIYLLGKDTMYLLVGRGCASLITIAAMSRQLNLRRRIERASNVFNGALARECVVYGFPTIGIFVVSQILALGDRYFIEFFLGSTAVGVYSSNYSMVQRGLQLVLGTLLAAVHPIVMDTWSKKGQVHTQLLIGLVSRYFLILAMPFMLSFTVLAKDFSIVMLGVAYREGYIIIPIALGGVVAWQFSMYGSEGLALLKRTDVTFGLLIGCAIVKIILNLVFIPTYGYIGAAASSLVSYLVYLAALYVVSLHFLKWLIPWDSVLRILASSVPSALVILWLSSALANRSSVARIVLLSGALVVFYPLVLYLLGEVRAYEVAYAKRLVSRVMKLKPAN